MAEETAPLKRAGQVQNADADDTLLIQGIKALTGDLELTDTANGTVTLSDILASATISAVEKRAILQGYNSGPLSGLTVTVNANDQTEFDIAAGSATVVNAYTDPLVPTIDEVTFAGLAGVARTTTGENPQATLTFLALDSQGTVTQFSENTLTTEAFRDHAFFGIGWHPEGDGNVIVLTGPFGQSGQGAIDALNSFRTIFGSLRQSGIQYAANGANASLDRSGGTLNAVGIGGFDTTAGRKRTNESDVSSASMVSIYRAYRDATNGLTVDGPTATWDPSVWDNGSGALQAFPGADNYGIARAYIGPGGAAILGVPQATYRTQADAFNALFAPVEERGTLARSVPCTWCVFRKNATVFNDPNEATFFEIPTLLRLSGGGTATVNGAQAVTRYATIPVTSPHSIRDPAGMVLILPTPGAANQLTAVFPSDTEATSGSFTFRVKVGPQGGSLATVGDVSITQGNSQGVLDIASPVSFNAGDIVQVEELAVGAFTGSANNVDKRCAVTMRYVEQ